MDIHKSSPFYYSHTTMNSNETVPIEVSKLSAKHEKFIVFSYWLSEQMKSGNENTSLEEMANIFSNTNEQIVFVDSFLADYKLIQNMYKKKVREMNKKSKINTVNEEQPQKKRGRKKKEVVDNRTEEERLMDEIVAKAQEV